MSYKNFLFKALVNVYELFAKPTPKTQVKKFLLVSTTALGDTIWATPAIRSLKETFPESSLSVLTSSIGAQVLKNNPYIDEVFLLKKTSFLGLYKLYQQMKKRSFTTALLFHTSQRPILPFCYMLGIREIIGTDGLQKGLDSLLSTKVEKKAIHEIERRLDIAQTVGATKTYKDLEIYLLERNRNEAKAWLERNHVSTDLPLIAMHPGAKDKFKQWDPNCFIELGRLIQKSTPCTLLITGTSGEKDLVEKIATSLPGAVSLAENLELLTFAAILEKTSLFIVGDTGPMHVAFALKKPTVAFFCATDPNLCGPYPLEKEFVRILYRPPTCLPCLRKKCTNAFCLLQISPKEVYQNAKDLLEKTTSVSS